jgi:hypothetical protein
MAITDLLAPGVLGLKTGELVEIRSAEEIAGTLDENGELDGLPFMPEMLAFCGRRLRVRKVAHKSCDNIARTGLRRMTDAVHLEGSRCDGSAHGACENACSLYWKEQWVKRLDPTDATVGTSDAGSRTLLPLLMDRAQKEPFADGEACYRCQATEMLRATPQTLPRKELSQYREDLRSGNAKAYAVVRSFLVDSFNLYQDQSRRVLPGFLQFKEGLHWRFLKGRVTSGRTPTMHLDLRPGELVRIKSREEILATLDPDLLNRGMGFDAEMSRFCGRTARVKARAHRCVDEKSGRMLTMKNPCIILEDIVCEGAFSANCPREFVCWWREIWLERVEPVPARE